MQLEEPAAAYSPTLHSTHAVMLVPSRSAKPAEHWMQLLLERLEKRLRNTTTAVIARWKQAFGKEAPQKRLAAFGESSSSVGNGNGQFGRHSL